MTTVTDAAYDDMAFARILVDAVEHGCTYEDRCVGVRAILKRHREAAEARARLEGAEIMREAAAKWAEDDAKLCDCSAHSESECACGAWCEWKTVPMDRVIEALHALDPAAILEAHTRAKATPLPSAPASPSLPSNPAAAVSSS